MLKQTTLSITSITILLLFGLASCSEPAPKIDYKKEIDTVATIANIIEDTTKVLVAELPVKFKKIETLIYPVALVNMQGSDGYGRSSANYYNGSDISSGYYSSSNLSGDFINLIFEDTEGNRKLLTEHKMTISQATFLEGIFDITQKGYLLYTVYDRDTNGDQKFNRKDLLALYISNVDGTGFTKVTKELHNYHDYRTHKESNKLYFRSLEDMDKDGEFSNQDKFHYYTITFNQFGYEIDEYDPLDAFDN